MTVFTWTLRDRRKSAAWWAAGIFGLVAFTIAFYPSIKGQANVDEVIRDLPPAMQALFGLRDGVPISSPPGYLWARLFASLLPILLIVLGIATGAGAIGGSEEDGTLELLLSNPVSRLRVALERYAALVALVAGQMILFTAELLALSPLVGALEGVSTGGLLAASGGAGAIAVLHGSIAFAIGASTGRRNSAIGAASAVAAAGYLAQGLLVAANAPEAVLNLTPWYWYLGDNLLIHGGNVVAWLPALLASVLFAAAGVVAFTRRDLH